MMQAKNLAEVILDGLATELDYMAPDAQAVALERFAYLQSCSEDELADAAEFIATAVRAERNT